MSGVHGPDDPFGCTVCWGPTEWYGPMHVCNAEEHHAGPHQCKCGASMTYTRIDGSDDAEV